MAEYFANKGWSSPDCGDGSGELRLKNRRV